MRKSIAFSYIFTVVFSIMSYGTSVSAEGFSEVELEPVETSLTTEVSIDDHPDTTEVITEETTTILETEEDSISTTFESEEYTVTETSISHQYTTNDYDETTTVFEFEEVETTPPPLFEEEFDDIEPFETTTVPVGEPTIIENEYEHKNTTLPTTTTFTTDDITTTTKLTASPTASATVVRTTYTTKGDTSSSPETSQMSILVPTLLLVAGFLFMGATSKNPKK
jgi:hypothetical protein